MTAAAKWDLTMEDLPELPEPGEDGTIAPQFIPDASLAEDAVRHLEYWYGERHRLEAQLAAERAKLEERGRRLLEQVDRRIAWHEGGLRAYLWQLGRRAWKGINGSISLRAGRERIEMRDEAAFLAWADAQAEDVHAELVRTTVAPCKSGIANWIKGDGGGELPPGVELVRGDETLVVNPQ